MNEVWPRIRAARKKLGLTQADFAALMSVTRTAVANWETGQSLPDMANMIRIAETTGMGFEYLATGRGREDYGVPKIAEESPPYMDRADIGRAQTPAELSLLVSFRRLSETRKKALLALINQD